MTTNLLSRLQGLKAPDREVDEAIHVLVSGVTAEWQEYRQANAYHRDGFWVSIGEIPAYTASLDAAVALCERVLPDTYGTIQFGGVNKATILQDSRKLLPSGNIKFSTEVRGYGAGATPAIALCIALIRVLEARDA